MVDLAYTPEELKEKQKMEEGPSLDDMAKYPWGTRLRLDNITVKKLGLNPQVGQEVKLVASAKVMEVEATEEADGDVRYYVALQMTDMELAKEASVKSLADALFGNKKGE